ncbi:hypothetical protein EGW08_016806 [Elysia chlorotica]|uniref:CENP-T/Histone H4 histone fold domain-containing protein n=1 Tax=Elysia chlorotica TaxID=188477 RepID=A0A433T1Q7_ELYCH|nr:hypothetical protein EGW08_016806 [Elysia chlorotica]
MSGGQDYRYDETAAKRSPSKSMPRGVHSSSDVYPGSGTKLRQRQSLRTPQQNVPLKFDDRVKNRRASKSFVLMDQSDLDTPRTRIEAFMGVAESVKKIPPSATKRKMSLQALTPREPFDGVFKAPRVSQLVAAGSVDRARVSSPGSKFTPRSNVWNLLQTGEEMSPVERTVSVDEAGTSPGLQNLTSVRNAGQRVSVSPINVSSIGTEKRLSRQNKTPSKARKRSFHLSSDQLGMEEYSPRSLSAIVHSGQRVSISPINVSDHRVEDDDLRQTKYKASRRSFHLDVPQTEEEDDQIEDDDAADGKEPSERNDSGQAEDIHENKTRNESRSVLESDENWSIPLAKRRESTTAILDLVTEHTSLKIGKDTDVITQGISLGPNTAEISPINNSMRQHRKSSASKHIVSVGGDLSLSAVQPVELSESEEVQRTVAGEAVGISDEDRTEAPEDGATGGDGVDHPSPISDTEKNNINNISTDNDHQNRTNKKSYRDDTLEEDQPVEEPNNPGTSRKRTLDALRSNSKEILVDNLELRRVMDSQIGNLERVNSKNNDEVTGSAKADPASVYDLSEGSSLEGLNLDRNNIKGSGSRQAPRSGKKTPGGSAKGKSPVTPSSQRRSSSKRKRLEFSGLTTAEGFGSPFQGRTASNSPRSSTPVDRSRRFFHSTKIQRSVTEYFQGNQDLASTSSALTPRTKDLFSGISPIRPTGALQKSGMRDKSEENIVDEEAISKQTSGSKRASGIGIEVDGRGQSSDDELPSFSSMATPHIDMRKRVFRSSLQRKSQSLSRSKVDKIRPQTVKNNQARKTRPARAPVTNLPRRTVKYFAELHSDMKLSKDAIEEIEKVSEHFWVDTFKALEAYTLHAGRKTVQDADAILLMKSQRLISGTDDLHHKIRQLMPMELRKDLIPCAYSKPGNK